MRARLVDLGHGGGGTEARVKARDSTRTRERNLECADHESSAAVFACCCDHLSQRPPPSPARAPSSSSVNPGPVTKSTITAADVTAQRAKARAIFNRDKIEKEERERERREKEEAAKKARAEAAERSRQASREWARCGALPTWIVPQSKISPPCPQQIHQQWQRNSPNKANE